MRRSSNNLKFGKQIFPVDIEVFDDWLTGSRCSQVELMLLDLQSGLSQHLLLDLHPLGGSHSLGGVSHLLLLLLPLAARLPQVPVRRVVPPLSRRHLRCVPLPPLRSSVLEPNLQQKIFLLLTYRVARPKTPTFQKVLAFISFILALENLSGNGGGNRLW